MTIRDFAPIDCDLHPALADTDALLPYLEDYWAEMVRMRTVKGLDLASYPPSMPLSGRPDWRPESQKPGQDFATLKAQALDGFGSRFAICNSLYGAAAMPNEDFAAVLCRAANQWMAKEWLDRDQRLRASILVPIESPELAVEEIERCAADRRFVQVMVLAMGDMPLGRRRYWPIYAASERLGLPIGIHAGSTYRHATTSLGWTSHLYEEYVAQPQAFAAQLLSLVSEGVFVKFPGLKVVLIESGFTWLPAFLWRFDKTWRGIHYEVPWLTRKPTEIIREHVRLTLQPIDGPPSAAQFDRVMDQLGSDELLLFSTDYPHWQYDTDDAVLPPGLSDAVLQKILVDNPLATYPRLKEAVR